MVVARFAVRPVWNKGLSGLTDHFGTVRLTALVRVLAGCASAASQEPPGKPEVSAPPSLDARLQALSEKYAVEERASRDPAKLRAQIANLEARRLRLLERYTPTHPSVLQVERQLRMLREQLAAAEAAPAATAPPAP
jgi:hypothetical protein